MILSPAWFAEHFGTFVFIFIVGIVAIHTYQKKSAKEKKEINRVEKSISENGLFKHHENEIIQNYGIETFLNKTPAEIEIIVNEYVDLVGLNFSKGDVEYLAREINKRGNESIKSSKGD